MKFTFQRMNESCKRWWKIVRVRVFVIYICSKRKEETQHTTKVSVLKCQALIRAYFCFVVKVCKINAETDANSRVTWLTRGFIYRHNFHRHLCLSTLCYKLSNNIEKLFLIIRNDPSTMINAPAHPFIINQCVFVHSLLNSRPPLYTLFGKFSCVCFQSWLSIIFIQRFSFYEKKSFSKTEKVHQKEVYNSLNLAAVLQRADKLDSRNCNYKLHIFLKLDL